MSRRLYNRDTQIAEDPITWRTGRIVQNSRTRGVPRLSIAVTELCTWYIESGLGEAGEVDLKRDSVERLRP